MSDASQRRAARRLCLALPCWLLWVACRSEPAPLPAPAAVVIGPESVISVERAALETGPVISGSLEARQRATLIAKVAGTVERVAVELGDRVERGTLLARIEASALDEALASARAAVASRRQSQELASRQLERTRRLVRAGALAEHDLELASSALSAEMAQLAQAEAQLASVREQRAGAEVRAPWAGVLSEKSVHQGDVVSLGAPLFTLIDPSSMRLRANVPSESLSALHLGAPVTFRVRGLGEREFVGKIERIGPAADPITRQIPLLITLPNPGGTLVAGLFAEGRVATRRETGLIVPEAALTRSADEVQVRRLKNDRVEVVPVELGLEDPSSERALVTSGLSAGDRVLTGAARDLADHTQVQLTGAPG